MTKKELAQLLGISGSMVSKLAKNGMPTDTLERAQRWRKRHLEPGRMKGTRFNPDEARTPKQDIKPILPNSPELVANAKAMLDIAAVANDAGQSIESLIPALRAALHCVPKHERGKVWPLPLAVMDILVTDVSALCGSGAGEPQTSGAVSPMSDAEAQVMGEFWYSVAAGECLAT